MFGSHLFTSRTQEPLQHQQAIYAFYFEPQIKIFSFFIQDISKVQRIVTASKSPMNISVMRRESDGVKACQMEKVSLWSN